MKFISITQESATHFILLWGNLKLLISLSFHAINIWNYMLRHVPIHISYESFKRLTKVHIQENNINYRMVY